MTEAVHQSPEATLTDNLPDPDLKIILLGDSAVGKSNPPLHIDFWDTAGQERFNSMHSSYYHRAHAALLVFDITRKATYQHLDRWYEELQGHRPGLPVIVVGNKVDEDEGVTAKVFAFTKKRTACVGAVRFVSAADGRNVVKVVREVVKVAEEYKRRGNEADFSGEVMDALDYFNKKESATATARMPPRAKDTEEEKSNADNLY